MFARLMNPGYVLLASGLLAGLGLTTCLTGSAAAAPAKQAERQRASNVQLREALHVLQGTKKMLQDANHDYGGHRVKAIKAIGAAEQQLRLALHSQTKHKKPGNKRSNPGKNRNQEPQNISNVQLADAIGILQRTMGLLQNANHDYGGHRAAAVRDLGAAIQQLKLALQFEKK